LATGGGLHVLSDSACLTTAVKDGEVGEVGELGKDGKDGKGYG
jgi:hypothetical protein